MSLNLLAILGGITGITGVATTPITSITSSSKVAKLLQVKDNFEYKVIKESPETNKLEIKVQDLSQNSQVDGLNSFPVKYTEVLTTGQTTTIPLDLMWNHARELEKQAEENQWASWGYSEAALLVKGSGGNGVVSVEATLSLSPNTLLTMTSDLNAVSHGLLESEGKLKTKVVSVGNDIAVQVLYFNPIIGNILLVQSNSISSVAKGAVIDYAGTMETSYFHFDEE